MTRDRADGRFVVPRGMYKGRLHAFTSREKVAGTITLHPPPGGHTVRFHSIVLRIEEYALGRSHSDRIVTRSVEAVLVDKPGLVQGRLEVPFELDLAAVGDWCDTYSGTCFGLQHVLQVEVTRPWFTWNVVQGLPLEMQVVRPGPKPSLGGTPAPHELVLTDAVASNLSLDFISNSYSLQETITGTVAVERPGEPIHRLEVLLLRSEHADYECSEAVVARQVCFDCGDGPSLGAGGDHRTSWTFPVSIPLSSLDDVTPTIFWSSRQCDGLSATADIEGDVESLQGTVFVRYFLRLSVFQGGDRGLLKDVAGSLDANGGVADVDHDGNPRFPQQFWDSREILLYRATPGPFDTA